jgi:hypothetical protein
MKIKRRYYSKMNESTCTLLREINPKKYHFALDLHGASEKTIRAYIEIVFEKKEERVEMFRAIRHLQYLQGM